MASNNISKYYKVDGGLDLTSDSQFATLSANEKIVYKPSGEKYIKNSNYSNVFDKTDTFGDLETKINTKAVGKITNADDNGVASYYNVAGNKIGEFKCGLPIIGSDGKTNVTAITRNGDILTVEVPRVYYDKYGRVTNWDKQVASAIVSNGSSSGVGYTGVPVGTISMWAGSVGDIPAGWHLCDGSAGTPDLRNRFVVGAGASYSPGNTGGSNTINANIGDHYHGIGNNNHDNQGYFIGNNNSGLKNAPMYAQGVGNSFQKVGWNGHGHLDGWNAWVEGEGEVYHYDMVIGSSVPCNMYTTGPIPSSGSSSTIDNRPPYYALCYIMKTQVDGSPTVVSNNNPELSWGQTLTVGSVDGKALTVRMPANPNTDTKYSAGTGLGLSGTTFYIDENWLRTFIGNNSGSGSGGLDSTEYEGYYMRNDVGGEAIVGQEYSGLDLMPDVSLRIGVLEFPKGTFGTGKFICTSRSYVLIYNSSDGLYFKYKTMGRFKRIC